jgi:transmembrane sensor
VREARDLRDHPDSLLDRAIRGELDVAGRAELDRHLARCATCAAELEVASIFMASAAPGPQDDALNRTAVEKALARLEDAALDEVAVEGALARLQESETLGRKLRRVLGLQGWLRPAVALGGVAAAVVIAFGLMRAPYPAAPSMAPIAASRTLVLEDGSEVAPADGPTAIHVVEQTPARTTVRLRSGSAQFRVRHDSRRLFRVDAGLVEIEDLGTVFRVAHESEGRVRVAVAEGRVAVLYPVSKQRVELGAGEERVFLPEPAPIAATEPASEAPRSSALSSVPVYARAQSRSRGAEDPANLLLAADVARRSHRPQAAVAPLRRLMERYPKDPRAPSAAFTLGWVLLTDLGRPREAAGAFAEAERIAPRGALAEDAAARVAEAWQKAGDLRRAAGAARHYEQMYPNGRHVPLMRGLVGEN